MRHPKVVPMCGRTGNAVANQYRVYLGNRCYFQSYETLIAMVDRGKVYLSPNWEYSRTTTKYLGNFLNCYVKDIREKLASGEYKIKNLGKD